MPKIKTHKGASKRFKRTASGKLKREHAFASHILRKKSRERKRRLRFPGFVDKKERKNINRLLSYS